MMMKDLCERCHCSTGRDEKKPLIDIEDVHIILLTGSWSEDVIDAQLCDDCIESFSDWWMEPEV